MNAKKLRVVSFNVFYALRRRRLAKTVFDAFGELNPDVICLQEVLIGKKRNFARDLADSLGYHLSFSLRAAFGLRQIGLAVLAKKPPKENYNVILPHSSPRRPRILQVVALQTKNARWLVANTHLSVASFKARQAQLAAVIETLGADYSGTPVILLGDFNTRTKKEVAVFTRMLRNAGFQISGALPYSWKMLGIKRKLDWIAARDCQIKKAGVLPAIKGSDHKPVWADVIYSKMGHRPE